MGVAAAVANSNVPAAARSPGDEKRSASADATADESCFTRAVTVGFDGPPVSPGTADATQYREPPSRSPPGIDTRASDRTWASVARHR